MWLVIFLHFKVSNIGEIQFYTCEIHLLLFSTEMGHDQETMIKQLAANTIQNKTLAPSLFVQQGKR